MPMNLLCDPLLRVDCRDEGTVALTLPQLLARLSTDSSVEGFVGLQRHQFQPWYCFLVQLAALACESDGTLAHTPDDWEARLRTLAAPADPDAAWSLVVENLSLPAFFQPPVPERSLTEWSAPDPCLASMEVLVVAKNHDLKLAAGAQPTIDQWVYGLVTYQTLQGFSGRDNYGIYRMNAGLGSRPMVGLVPSLDLGTRFHRDASALLSARPAIQEQYGYGGRVKLMWLEFWDGEKPSPLGIGDLHPYVLEISRRVRLTSTAGVVTARYKGTKAPWVAAGELKGNTGDPWAPVNRNEGKVLTVPAGGFTAAKLHEILTYGDYAPGVCLQVQPDDPSDLWLHAVALTRGQGKTEGFHERWIPIPGKIRHRLTQDASRASLGELGRRRLAEAKTMQNKVLRMALLLLVQGGPAKINRKDHRVNQWTQRFETIADRAFFEQLWASLDCDPEERERQWPTFLLRTAREVLEEAEQRAPVPHPRRPRAVAVAWRMLYGSAYKAFPILKPRTEEAA